MKKVFKLFSVLLVAALLFTGCQGNNPGDADSSTGTDNNKGDEKPLKVVLLINSVLGDKSYLDSAAHGIKLMNDELGGKVETKIIEMGIDNSKWEPTIMDVSEEDWDVIITGQFSMKEYVEKAAAEYPDKKYIIFDSSVNYEGGKFPNVYSVEFKTNEASFLAGSLAARLTTSKIENTNDENLIGFVGGQDIPLINDFLIGYIQGAKHADENIKVSTTYVGSFRDSAKGKEMSLAQFNSGVDISFNCAGQAGLGLLDAAKMEKRYAIGVDADQAMMFADSDPEKAASIPTSVLKNLDQALLRAVKKHLDGTLSYGKTEILGLKEGAVGLAENEYYEKAVPEEIRKEISELKGKIESGELVVDSAIGMDAAKVAEIINSVKP